MARESAEGGVMERGRILFVAREFTGGGAARLALGHIRRLAARYEIDLLVTGVCDEKMVALLPAGVTFFRLDAYHIQSDAPCADFFARYRDEPVFRREYRAVLATAVFATWHACFAVNLTRAGRKLVFLVDEELATYPELRLEQRHAVDCCLAAADIIVPVSRRLRERMAGRCPPLAALPWRVLRPPVDVENIVTQSRAPGAGAAGNGKPSVLTVSRLTPDKQVLECLHVHHRLRQAGLDFQWHVAGMGPQEPALRAEIDRLGMADAFLLHGYVENVYSMMRECDCFALLSSSEGCPTSVMEALVLGRPVIMTDVNGADELVAHGRTGLVVPNEPGAIAEGLAWMVGDAALRERLRGNIAGDPLAVDPERDTAWLVEQIEAAPRPKPPARATPEVSILIPACNHERYIERAIASALMQDFDSFEVVVADDASTDATGDVARKWSGDPRFRYVRNERNVGRVANYRNALNEHARGEWVVMLDGDDYFIDPGFIRRARETLRRHADAKPLFAQAGHRVHYAIPCDKGDVDITPPILGAERLMPGAEYLRFVFDTGFFTHLGTMYRRDAAIAGGFYTAEISSSDMDSLLRLALEGNVIVLNTVAGNWVQHGGNASSNLPLDRVLENAGIFRRIARMGARRGLVSMRGIEASLTEYEAGTLIHLFLQTLGKSARSPLAVTKMLLVAFRVNPRLLSHKRLMAALGRYFEKLCRPMWNRRARAPEGGK
ncbi:MAG TPA: glycosyltransferase [Chthoniobacteraceae bacterium]|nr:glycosyltransferase [Chthoniobacteraceae bacterium]